MKLSNFESRLYKKISDALPAAAPGCQLQVHSSGRKVCDIAIGQTYPYYDLASLTKIIFTVPEMMKLFEEGKWTTSTTVQSILSWFPSETVRIADLLMHTSGLTWWKPFFEKIMEGASENDGPSVRWQKLDGLLRLEKLEGVGKTVYSDLGFFVLGSIIQELEQKPLLDVWNSISDRLYPGITSLTFHPNNVPKAASKLYAPTERCAWRGKMLQGEVHDDNAWSLAGVSTHAGLFGSIDDVSWYGHFLRSQLMGVAKSPFRIKTSKLFMSRNRPLGEGDFALGFMMRSPTGASSGDYFSVNSIGHTGFTGTSIWFDPDADLLVVLLSNRVLFGRTHEEFKKLRPAIHNWVVSELKRA